jgi:hypothetical protein
MDQTNTLQVSRRPFALVAGISLLIMTVAAIFSYGFVHSSLVNTADPSATLQNIRTSSQLFGLEIIGWVIIVITDVLVAYAFYRYLAPISKGLARLTGLTRLVYSGILALAVGSLVRGASVASASVASTDQVADRLMGNLIQFESLWSMGLILFGAHLFLVGWVVLRDRSIPKLWGYLLLVAGVSYTLIHLLGALGPAFASTAGLLETVLGLPMMVGEVGFGIWLLIKG